MIYYPNTPPILVRPATPLMTKANNDSCIQTPFQTPQAMHPQRRPHKKLTASL